MLTRFSHPLWRRWVAANALGELIGLGATLLVGLFYFLRAGEAHQPVKLLINLQDAVMSQRSAEYVKNQMVLLAPKVEKVAVIGVSGLKAIIVQGISRSFGDIEHKSLILMKRL